MADADDRVRALGGSAGSVRLAAMFWISIPLLSVIFGAVELTQSLRSGQLAYPVTYDTNTYFVVTLRCLEAFHSGGFAAFVQAVNSQPGRSFTTAVLALLGWSMLGVNDWAPCVAQIAEVVLLLAVTARLARRAAPIVRAGLMIAVLCWPVAGFLVIENRPDILWGLATAGGVALLLSHDAVAGSRRTLVAAGLMAGLALMSKPTVLLVTGVLLLVAALALIAVRKIQTVPPLRNWAFFVLPALLLPLPYLVLVADDIWVYVRTVAFSPRSADFLLEPTGSNWDEALYYLVGTGGAMSLGPWLWVVCGAASASAAVSVVRRDVGGLCRGSAYGLATAAAYLAITLPRLKSPFFTMAFAFMLLFAFVDCTAFLATSLAPLRRHPFPLALVLAILGSLLFAFPSSLRQTTYGTRGVADAAFWRLTVDGMVDAAASEAREPTCVYLSDVFEPLNPATLQWTNDRDGVSPNRFVAVTRPRSSAEFVSALDASGMALILDADAVALPKLAPSPVPDTASPKVPRDPGWERIESFPSRDGRPLGTLFRRLSSFLNFDHVEGLDRVELREEFEPGTQVLSVHAPVYQFAIRRMKAGTIAIPYDGSVVGVPVLEASVMNEGPPRDVAISVDGNPRTTWSIGPSWTGYRLDLLGSTGRHVLQISSPVEGGAPADGLLFRRLQLVQPR